MKNSTTFAIFLLFGVFLTSTITMLPAAYAGGGDGDDNNNKGGDGNKQRVEEEGAGAIADCDWNDIEESDFQCIAAAASDEGIRRDIGGPTPPPDDDGGFTVTGEGSEGEVQCIPPTGDIGELLISFSAQGEDGTVTGTYTISIPIFSLHGVITEGTTDGSTYTLSGENESICGNGEIEITISGDCGDDVTIKYEEAGRSAVATFTGDVECTLLA